jgi:hypothetical protein
VLSFQRLAVYQRAIEFVSLVYEVLARGGDRRPDGESVQDRPWRGDGVRRVTRRDEIAQLEGVVAMLTKVI